MTMAASVELRAPFLDHELMELAFSLPDDYKLQNGTGKFILKDIMKDILPKEIVYRKKRGFPVPLTSWFGGELQSRAKDLLTSEKALKRGYFRPHYINELFTRINHGEDLGKRIFSLVALEMWHQKYID
jgi:asparagine synthase (glutamine-hydrolysing)